MTKNSHRASPVAFLLFFVCFSLSGQLMAASRSMSISGPSGALLGWLMSKSEMSTKSGSSSFEKLLQQAEMLYMDGGVRSTASLLASMLLDPSFSDQKSSPLWDNALYLLAASLASRGAVGKARKILMDLVSKVPASDFAGPALRKLVDLTLASRQFKQTLVSIERTRISEKGNQGDEILYMKGKALYKLGFIRKAVEAFRRVSNSSRLYAAAVFMQGIISIEQSTPDNAEKIFCKLTHGDTERETPFFISDDATGVIQNARLALARLSHDRGRFEQAIDTYASISSDSPLYVVAQYESAWSRFRLGDYSGAERTIRDLLESHSNFPRRPMAKILLGYSLLGQCSFEEAKAVFEATRKQLDSILEALEDDAQPPGNMAIPTEALLWITSKKFESKVISMQTKIRKSISWERWLTWQVNRRWPLDSFENQAQDPGFRTEQKLRYDIERADGMLQKLTRMRVELSRHKNNILAIKDLHIMQEQALSARKRASEALTRLWTGRDSKREHLSPSLPGSYFTEEAENLDTLKSQLLDQYDRAKKMASIAKSILLKKSKSTCAELARSAMLGIIDAATGKKQALETEVQNLALGRYPMSLLRDLAKAGLLDEESEYWPFDGESWPDEYE